MGTEEVPSAASLPSAATLPVSGWAVKNFKYQQPLRAKPTKERKHGDVIKALTVNLVDTYSRCSNDFKYSLHTAPRRVLTKMSKGVHNGGYDNAEHDYICRVGDQIVNPDGQAYEILERLGHGSFGQVLKCQRAAGSTPIALKIIKNKPAYFHQALVEVRILQMLNHEFDPDDENRLVRMLDFFVYRKHLCIAFELLSVNLYDVLKQNNFRGVSMALIRVLTEQLLKAMRCLRTANVIHCDLKPENVLLSDMQHTRIKLIDFGSACFEGHTVYSYIQSRFYRSPEVLVGLPYTSAIDMWSLGCICAELFLGLPIFPGCSEFDQVCRIVDVQGLPPAHMLDAGKFTRRYFRRVEERVEENPDSGGSASSAGNSEGGGVDGKPVTMASASAAGAVEDLAEAAGSKESREAHEDASSKQPEAPPQESDGQQGASESIFDLLKRKLSMVGADAKEESGDCKDALAPNVVIHPPGSSVGSTMSTAPGRVPSSGDDASKSADVRSEPKARTDSSDGGAADGVGTIDVSGLKRTQSLKNSRGRRRGARTCWRLKTREEYERSEGKKEPTPKKYFNYSSLQQMIDLVPYNPNLSRRGLKEEKERRLCFLQFLHGLFQINPQERWTPNQASLQAFVMGAAYDPHWTPPADEPVRPASDSAVHGLWGHLCAGIPLPDDHPAESYRPPIDKLTEDFFKNTAFARQPPRQVGSGSEQAKVYVGHGRGASFCSSASSTGSTPTGGRGMRTSPYYAGSPHSVCTGPPRGHPSHGSLPQNLSGTTVTPVSSPHGSTASTTNTRRTPQGMIGQGGAPMHSRAVGSRDGSRGSSPWHLPSPMSELSTGSDRVNSSQPSGSDSCGELMAHTWVAPHYHYDETGSEDPSQSDTPGGHWLRSNQLSDSDSMTPQSHDAAGHSARGSSGAEEERGSTTKDTQHVLWENIKSEITRGELSRQQLPRRLENTLSPGNAGPMGNFRHAVGMHVSGPVVPPSARRAQHAWGAEDGGAPGGSVPGHGNFNPLPRSSRGVEERRRGRRHNGTV